MLPPELEAQQPIAYIHCFKLSLSRISRSPLAVTGSFTSIGNSYSSLVDSATES